MGKLSQYSEQLESEGTVMQNGEAESRIQGKCNNVVKTSVRHIP